MSRGCGSPIDRIWLGALLKAWLYPLRQAFQQFPPTESRTYHDFSTDDLQFTDFISASDKMLHLALD